MKAIFTLLIYVLTFVSIAQAEYSLEKLLSFKELDGYEENEYAVLKLDERFTFFGSNRFPYVWDNDKKQKLRLDKVDGLSDIEIFDQILMPIANSKQEYTFHYDKGILSYVGFEYDHHQSFLIEFDLLDFKHRVYPIKGNGKGQLKKISFKGREYYLIVNDISALYERKGDDLEFLRAWEFDWGEDLWMFDFGTSPLEHQGYIYVHSKDHILTYDLATEKEEIIIKLDSPAEQDKRFVLTQFLADGKKTYSVIKTLKVVYAMGIGWMPVGFEGEVHVVMSEGIKDLTDVILKKKVEEKLDNLFDLYNEVHPISHLALLNEQLIWTDVDSMDKVQLSIFNYDDFELIGEMRIPSTIEDKPLIYLHMGMLTWDRLLSLSKYTYKGDEYVLYVSTYYDLIEERRSLYWNLWTVKDGKIKYLLKDFKVGDTRLVEDEGKYNVDPLQAKLITIEDDQIFYFLQNFYNTKDFTTQSLEISANAIDINKQSIQTFDAIQFPIYVDDWTLMRYAWKSCENYFVVFQTDDAMEKTGLWKFDKNTVTFIKNDSYSSKLISIYPNPSSNNIQIVCDEDFSGTLRVVGIDGKTYLSKQVNGKYFPISISQLNDGIYIVILENELEIRSQKFIKQ